jgi:rod shape-determining protein MreD
MSRVAIFVLLGFALVTVLGPLQQLLRMDMVILDAPLIIVLYLAMAGSGTGLGGGRRLSSGGIDWSGGLAGVLLGYICDVLGGGVKGLHCLTLVVVFLLAHRAARHVYLAGALPVVVVTFVASVFSSLLGLGVRWLGGVTPSLGSLTVMGAQAVLCAAFAPLMMQLCRFVDAKLAHRLAARRLRR